MKISIKRKYRFLAALLLLLSLLIVVISNFTIEISAKGKTFNDPAVIPKNKVGLVLGTSRMLVEGGVNPYYAHRINATIKLYKAGKIEYVLVSGDNGSIYYNEPTTIKKDLVKRVKQECNVF